MILHEFHARSLEATLSRADEAIHRMERLLANHGEGGVIRKVENTLSPEQREALLPQLRELQGMLKMVAANFSLQSHALDIRRVLDAELSTLRVLFEDCRPQRMKGYGQPFAADARAAQDETVDRLLAQVLKMRDGVE